jgi:hypothetical protein
MIPYIQFPQKKKSKTHHQKKKKNKNKNRTQTHTSGQHDSPNDKALYKQIENETLSH